MPLTVAAINAVHDWFHRGAAAPTLPANWYYALLSAVPTTGLPNGTEITAGGVARVSRARNTTLWSGTQGAGSTGASSGTTTPGVVRNNDEIEFAASASAAVSGAVGIGLFDAASGGNCWEWTYIKDSGGTPVSRSWATGDRVYIAEDAAQWRLS
jgi:hypothetical protein